MANEINRYDQIQIGDKAEIKHEISAKDIERFVALTGDDNKIHIDKEYASQTSFKKPVAHGMLSASFISTIIGTKIPGDGALWFSQSLEFLMPVRVGDTITVVAEVIAKHESINAIELQTDIFNQHKQKVISGRSKVKVIEQQTTQPDTFKETESRSKVALIIGATGGIGYATALKLAEKGYSIAVHFNSNEGKADDLVEKIILLKQNSFSIQSSILNQTSVLELIEKVEKRLGPITLMVNCAAIKIPNIKFDSLEWEDIQMHLDINIKANFLLAKAIVPSMKKNQTGKIIFISSQFAESTPPTEWLPYVSAKYALNGFAKALAVELAPYKINVNLVSPGVTDTELISDMPEKSRMLISAKTPLRRLAKPLDIANAIAFLASSDSAFITGETIRVNGGSIML
jgi:3-oxoacyl-[acyl-carrier protein] reductase